MMESGLYRCPSCSESEVVMVDDVFQCNGCNAIFPILNGLPILVEDPEEHEQSIHEAQKVNPEWYLEEQPPEAISPWRHHLRKRRNYVENILKKEFEKRGWKKAGRVLDLGCGDGNNLEWLGKYAEQLYGSDYNLVRLTRSAARNKNTELFLANILNYPVFDNNFDVIFFNHVLEHIHDDVTALETVYRILKPGGILVLGVPNEGSWWWQLAYDRAPDIRKTTDHVHFYTSDMIAEKMQNTNFTMIEIKHLGWGPPDFYLDGKWRKYKIVDDLFEFFGRIFIPKQASSLYLIATK